LQLDVAAPVLAQDSKPIILAKIDAEKHSRVASKYQIRYRFMIISKFYLACGPVAEEVVSWLAKQ
jgi:hypothetical protein